MAVHHQFPPEAAIFSRTGRPGNWFPPGAARIRKILCGTSVIGPGITTAFFTSPEGSEGLSARLRAATPTRRPGSRNGPCGRDTAAHSPLGAASLTTARATGSTPPKEAEVLLPAPRRGRRHSRRATGRRPGPRVPTTRSRTARVRFYLLFLGRVSPQFMPMHLWFFRELSVITNKALTGQTGHGSGPGYPPCSLVSAEPVHGQQRGAALRVPAARSSAVERSLVSAWPAGPFGSFTMTG